ncbi:MAG: hypothetical protein ACREQQ_02985 [Candidatus Binatia bacterium]
MRRLLACALAASVLGLGGALAEDAAERAVDLRVRTVLADNGKGAFDARLNPACRRQLSGLFRFSSYRLMKEEARQVPWGRPNNFEIPGGRYLEVLPMAFKENRLRLRVLLIEGTSPPPLDTDFSVPNHGNIWVGGPKHRDGVLLISIGAETIK